jgi:PIN domain nuclease of toxin-antitoxin system
VLLWVAGGRLDRDGRDLIDRADAVLVSAASIWEIEVKRASGRLEAPADVGARAVDEGFEPLPITFEHALSAGRLPRHHGDPFDRMLVAQASVGGLTLATADAALRAYDVQLARVRSAAG